MRHIQSHDIQDRWDTAKKIKLCYHCLGNDHSGQMCIISRPYTVNNCKSNHNRLLHNDMPPTNHIDEIENRQSMDHGEVDGGKAEREADTIVCVRSHDYDVREILWPPCWRSENIAYLASCCILKA